MRLQTTLLLFFVAAGLSNPLALRNSAPLAPRNGAPPGNGTFFSCTDNSSDPRCAFVKHPSRDVITRITHPNGTTEVVRNKYTREQLQQIRIANNISSVEYQPGEKIRDKREGLPLICTHETQEWFDQYAWGFWYQAWHQVGSCFYCDSCDDAIATSFGVSETWTAGLQTEFSGILKAQFSFSWGNVQTLTDTRRCRWQNVQNGCHSIWYQPLMSWHNGWPNYQTHVHCPANQGDPAYDYYYDHNYVWANVNQAANNNGINSGNLGCDSGCQGPDRRQCEYGNTGGQLWPNAN